MTATNQNFWLAFAWLLLASCSSSSVTGLWVDDPLGPEAFRRIRDQRRAYDGAPPTIPHRVAELGRENCLSCHRPGSLANGQRVGPPRSHPAWGDCRQCHVEQQTSTLYRTNAIVPLRWPARGFRHSEIAPPMVPHGIQNREDCAVCHVGEQAHPVLRVGHGNRQHCRQCHLTKGGGV